MSDSTLGSTAALFLALGDPTRLRLLNLMCEREVCVSSFTAMLGQSQPLVSRHLAYLRNAGVVQARREGKWIHYRVSGDLDDNTQRLLTELFKWMEKQPALHEERSRYYESVGMPSGAPRRKARRTQTSKRPRQGDTVQENESVHVTSDETYDRAIDVAPDYGSAHHNELEDFLL